MKNRIGTGIYFCLAAFLIGAGPKVIFKVCEQGNSYMKCWWSSQAEIGIAIILAVIGLGILFFQEKMIRLGLSFAAIGAEVVGILIPTVLIGGCMSKSMACQSITFPCLYVISSLTILVAVGNSVYLYKQIKKNNI